MFSQLRPAVLMLLVMSLLTGLAYPLAITGIAQLAFPYQANGSLLLRDGKAVGSELIGQPFDEPRYFWSRPSATSPQACNAASSSGSNLALTNPALVDSVKGRVARLRASGIPAGVPIPVDLVTASGSGLDPHISVDAARLQVSRVARARNLSVEAVQRLVDQHTAGRQLGLLGEPRVNVLELNLALESAGGI